MVIAAANPSTDELERSFLIQPYSANTTTIKVQDTDRFVVNSRIMLGHMGYENTEVVTVSAVNVDAQTLTIGATKFSHATDDPIYVLRFDQIKFYRSTTGSTGTYTLLVTVDMDVDNDTLTTYYDDTTGVSTYYYKSALYHSISTLEATQSDPVSGGGYTRGQVGRFITSFTRELNDLDGSTVDADTIIGWINDCSDDLTGRVRRPYSFLHTRSVLNTTAGLETIDFPTDMWKFDDFEYVYTPDATTNTDYPLRVLSYPEFRLKTADNTVDDDDNLQFITLDTAVNKFRLYPTPLTSQTGVIYLYYWKYFDEIDSEGDEFETPTPLIYELYCLERYYRRKSRTDSSQTGLADRYERKYEAEAIRLPLANRKDAGSPRGLRFNPQTFKGNRQF